MYAVIATGGKQYRVVEGEILKIQKLAGDVGSTIDFNEVLLVGEGEQIKMGTPLVKGSKVTASILAHGRDKKIHIIKMKRRKHHMKRMGHRQDFTQIKIEKIA